MKNEAMKRIGGRRKSSQSDYPLKGKKTVEIIGEEFGDSAKQVQRYLKLTDLIPELLEKLDNGELSFNPAVELSYLTIEEQKEFIDAMEYIASFEKWYANQVKYHKVNGEEPGKNLKKWSYSISEVAKMLGMQNYSRKRSMRRKIWIQRCERKPQRRQ